MSEIQVLIVDDDPLVRETAASWLARPGFRFESVADGRSALERMRRVPPDVLICDVDMPGGLNGFQVLEALRREPALAQISVMMLTRHASRASVRLGMTLGADDYLPKPFTAAELVAAFGQLMAKRARAGIRAETAVRQHRWRARLAYGVAALALCTSAISLFLWREATERLQAAQRQLDRAATVADARLPQLLGAAKRLLRDAAAVSADVAAAGLATGEACRQRVAALAQRVPSGGELGWVAADGSVLCRSGTQAAAGSVANRPFFTQARDSGRFAAGDYSIDQGVPVLTSAIAMRNAAGRFAGVAYFSQDIRPSAAGREERDTAPGLPGAARAATGESDADEAGDSQAPARLELSTDTDLARNYLILFGVLASVSLGFAGWASGAFAKWAKVLLHARAH